MGLLRPMLIGAESQAFDDPEYLYEIKFDGERCLLRLDPAAGLTEPRNKRDVLLLPKFPELAGLDQQVRGACLLDGELIVAGEDGEPDFAEVQRRSLMSAPYKIQLAAKARPASYVAYDILELSGEPVIAEPLWRRKELLAGVLIKETSSLALSRWVQGRGTALFALAKERGLEGVVAKKRDSVYRPGTRTRDWVKIKNTIDDDFVVCGYINKELGVISLVLGQYDGEDRLLYRGHVTTGVNSDAFSRVSRARRRRTPPFDSPVPAGHGNELAVWLCPSLVCSVKFMAYNAAGGLRQPALKGLREDKSPRECRAPEPVNKGGDPYAAG